jgi:RNA-directed DNA polymerase
VGGSHTVWQDEVLWLCKKIIFHNPTEDYFYRGDKTLQQLIPVSKSLFSAGSDGLPIGNLTSQFFANIYLNELDHFVTNTLSFSQYIRYVDDFVIIGNDPALLRSVIPKIDTFLWNELRLHLHPKKIQLQPVHKGIDFLGYFVRSSHILVRQKVVGRFKDKLRSRINPLDGLLLASDIPMVQSYLGHFGHANTYRLRNSIN